MNTTVWLTGMWIEGEARWQVVGIFTTREAAVAASRTAEHFVGPVPLDVDLGDAPEKWPGAFVPVSASEG